MKHVSEILTAPREELIAYLKSWNRRYKDAHADFELRLMAHKLFRKAGPGVGPVPVAETASGVNS